MEEAIIHWLKLSAKEGYPEALLYIAPAYFYCVGVSEDRKTAAHWCRKAIDSGSDEAKILLK